MPMLSTPDSMFVEVFPPVCMYVKGDVVTVLVNLGGVRTEDVHFYLDEDRDTLIIKGETFPPERIKGAECLAEEINFGPFERKIKLPFAVDENRIEVDNYHGLFSLKLHKKEKEKRILVIE